MSDGSKDLNYRSKRSQKGEAELMIFGIVVIICALISGSLWVLNWVKDSKNAKVENRRYEMISKQKQGPFVARADPAQYVVQCNGSVWKLLQTNYRCEVLPESYGELYIEW